MRNCTFYCEFSCALKGTPRSTGVPFFKRQKVALCTFVINIGCICGLQIKTASKIKQIAIYRWTLSLLVISWPLHHFSRHCQSEVYQMSYFLLSRKWTHDSWFDCKIPFWSTFLKGEGNMHQFKFQLVDINFLTFWPMGNLVASPGLWIDCNAHEKKRSFWGKKMRSQVL